MGERFLRLTGAVCLALGLVSSAAAGAPAPRWGETGSPVTEATGAESVMRLAADGAGGLYVFGTSSGPSPLDVVNGTKLPPVTLAEGSFLQRLDADGRRPWSRDGRQPTVWRHVARNEDAAVPDGAGGVFAVWTRYDSASPYRLWAQRFDSVGRALWQENGIPVVENGCLTGGPCGEGKFFAGAKEDGAGGIWILWTERIGDAIEVRLFAQRLDASGKRLLGPFGIQVTSGSDWPQRFFFHPTEGGALTIVFEHSGPSSAPTHRARRIDGAGHQIWGTNAVELGSDMFRREVRLYIDSSTCATSDGGVILGWVDERPTADQYVDLYAQKVEANGTVAWQEGGVPVSMRPWGQLSPSLVCDDEGGAIIFFEDVVVDAEGTPRDLGVFAQRLSAAGLPLWAGGAIRIDRPNSDGYSYGYWPIAVSDGRGGAVVVWDSFWEPYWEPGVADPELMMVFAQRVSPDGELLWGPNGVWVHERPILSLQQSWGPTTRTISDARGGVFVAFHVARGEGILAADIFAQRVNDLEAPTVRPPFLLVHREGNASGLVRSTAGEIDCGLTCGANRPPSGSVTLVAEPERGARFLGWGGDCATATTAVCTVSIDADRFVVARFGRAPDRIGVYRPSIGGWLLDLDGAGRWQGCGRDGCLGPYGIAGDLPVPGDWSGAGFSALGAFRPWSGAWYLDFDGSDDWSGCDVDGCAGPLGTKGDLPVSGDWHGSGVAAPGVFRPSTGYWFLDRDADGGWDGYAAGEWAGPFGGKGDLPVAGDWVGDGRARFGVFRPSDGRWYLDEGNGSYDGCQVDRCLGPFGVKGDQPVVGDWSGNGKASIGVFRPSTGYWYLDLNADGRWNGCAVDSCLGPFGGPGDVAIAGRW